MSHPSTGFNNEGHYYLPTPIKELMAAVVVPLVLYLLFQTAEWVAWMGPDKSFRKISTILNHANMACGFMLAWSTGIWGLIRGPSEFYGAYIVFLGYDALLVAIYLWIWYNVFYIDEKPTITSSGDPDRCEIAASGELAKHAVSEGTKAVAKFTSS